MEDLPRGLASSNAPRIAGKLGSISAGKVLDVGTADEDFIDVLIKTLEAYDSFVGIDYCASDRSRTAMESAQERCGGKPVQFLRMNAGKLGFDDESFDTVCISHSLHHLADTGRVMAEMKRVLKAGGRFMLQEMYCDGEQTDAQKTDALQHEWSARIDSLLGITHNKPLRRREIVSIVRHLKLRETEIIDSTHLIDCLFCERRHECEDPRNQAILHDSMKGIDEEIERIRDHPDVQARTRLMEDAEQIRQAIAEFGASPPSYLFAIGVK